MAFIEIQYIYGTTDLIPYTAAELAQLQYGQSGASVYITHPNHPPARMTRFSDTDWRYEYLVLKNGPYMEQFDGEDLIQLSITGATDRVTLRAKDTAAFSGLTVGGYIEYPIENRWAIGQVVSVDSATQVTVDCLEDRCFVPSTEVYCRGRNQNVGTPDPFVVTAPVTVSGNTSPVFSHSFVVTREVVKNFLRFATDDGTVYWMYVTKAKAPTHENTSYGASADGQILSVRRPTQVVTRVKREILGTLVSSDAAFFDTTRDLGRWYRLFINGGYVNMKTVANGSNSTTQMAVTMEEPVPVSTDNPDLVARLRGTNAWKRGAFYVGNYPTAIALHEQRLVLGGTAAEPNTVWTSRSADFLDFSTADSDGKVLDDHGITMTLSSATLNEILWTTSRGAILVGTSGGEWSISSSSNREALTPTNVKAEQHSAFGSVYTPAVVAAQSTLFLQGGGRKVREMTFQLQRDGYESQDATIFAEHILKDHGGGVSIAYQQLPDSIVYVVCDDGQLAVLTYEPDQKVYAWSRYIIGGNNARVNAIAVDQTGEENIVYINVTRSVNGADFTTIETLRTEFRPGSPTDKFDMIFLDGYQDIPLVALTSNSIPGAYLDPYRGETVNILIDNSYVAMTCPTTGDLLLPSEPTTRVVIGYPFRSYMKTLPMDLPSQLGTTQAKTKRVSQLAFRLLDSLYLEHGAADNALRPLNCASPGNAISASDPMFTGDLRQPFDGGFDGRQQIIISTNKPLPLTLLAIYPEVTQTQ